MPTEANDLVVNNMRLVFMVANKYRGVARMNGIDYDDIMSAGNVGLVIASRSFDSSLGFKFSSYASRLIMDQIIKFLNKNLTMLYVPRNTSELRAKIIRNDWIDNNPEDIAKEVGQSLKAVKKALQSLNIKMLSTDFYLGETDNSSSVGDMLPFDDDVSQLHVDDFLHTLSAYEIQLLKYRFDGLTQLDISKLVGKSQMSVSRQLASIREKFIERSS